MIITRFGFLFLFFVSQAHGQVTSGGTRGGGNDCSIDFSRMGSYVYEYIKQNDFYFERIDMEAFRSVVNSATVLISENDKVTVDGIEYDAVNYPSELKIVVGNHWCKHRFSARANAALAFHEYLGLISHDLDKGYRLSRQLYMRINRIPLHFRNLLITQGEEAELIPISTHYFSSELSSYDLAIYNSKRTWETGERLRRLVVNCLAQAIDVQGLQMHSSSREVEEKMSVESETTYTFKTRAECYEFASRRLVQKGDYYFGITSGFIYSGTMLSTQMLPPQK
jgi:hypothetical protein